MTTTTDVRELQRELSTLRRDLRAAYEWMADVGAARVGVSSLLLARDLDAWRDELLAATFAQAERDQTATSMVEGWSSQPRAKCPLCGDSPATEHGYTMPEGLRRHLHRHRYADRRDWCVVMDAVRRVTRAEGDD